MPRKRNESVSRQAKEQRGKVQVYTNEANTVSLRELQVVLGTKFGWQITMRSLIDKVIALGIEATKKEHEIK